MQHEKGLQNKLDKEKRLAKRYEGTQLYWRHALNVREIESELSKLESLRRKSQKLIKV